MEGELANGNSEQNNFFEIIKKVVSKNEYSIFIKDSIRETSELASLLNLLRTAGQDDVINIYINSSGGWLNTTQQILNAMHDCKAEITTIADGRVASAATIIFMAGTNKVIKPNSHFMFHNYNTGASGKGHELIQQVSFQNKYYADFLQKYYKDFLSEQEIKDVIDGKDIWMSGDEFKCKFEKTNKKGVKK